MSRPTQQERADQLYTYLATYICETGFDPSFRDIIKHTQETSLSTVSRRLGCLAAEGKIIWLPGVARAIRLPE
jgi:SOS-response transcriptional repressor LexA